MFILLPWPSWPWLLTCFWKNLAITFDRERYGFQITQVKTFLLGTNILILWPRPWLLTYVTKKINLGHYILTVFPCGKTLLLVPNIFTLWPWPSLLTYLRQNLSLGTKKLTLWPWPWLLTYFGRKKLYLGHNLWINRDFKNSSYTKDISPAMQSALVTIDIHVFSSHGRCLPSASIKPYYR